MTRPISDSEYADWAGPDPTFGDLQLAGLAGSLRSPTREEREELDRAHAEGGYDEVPREFCPSCEAEGRRA